MTRYRRTGEVTARRLSRPLAWTTARGSVLRGQAGDWLVSSSDGGDRTVSDAAFHASYEPVGDGRYRRTGEVSARRAPTREVVETSEGPATAEPGDWVVTADDGSSWPVPDRIFRATYERSTTAPD
jgi:hypothetical protein